MKLYFDMNIYNRVFDDQTQLRIRFESMAIDILFELIEKADHLLVWSFILEYENSRNPFVERRIHINSMSTICKLVIEPNNNIIALARSIIDHSNTTYKDALHLASAIHGECDYFISCDDRFINTIEKNRLKLNDILSTIKLYNPVDFLRKELDVNVIE